MNTNLILVVTAFLGTFGIVLFAGVIVAGRQKRISARLRELTSATAPIPAAARSQGRKEYAIPVLTRLITGRRFTDRLISELSAAGLPVRPSEFIIVVVGAVILLQLAAFLVGPSVIERLALGGISIALPAVIVRSLQNRRRAAFDAQIADTLVTMAASFRSGFSLLRAMQMVAQEMPPPISKEFERIVNEVGVGRPMEDALRAAVARVGSYDFDLVVTAVLIHLQVGGNLSEMLETIADTIRERAKVIGEMKALTAEARISGLVLVILPVALAIILYEMRPEYMSMMLDDPIGPSLIWTAVALQAVGVLIMRRMLTLDV